MITGTTRIHSLYGSSIAHSLSPVIFNTTFEKLSLNRTYIPFEVSRTQLKSAVEAARTLGFDGFNVTMPHKINILEMLDRLDETAKKDGSANTVALNKHGLVGYNTDGEGAMRALKSYGFEPEKKRILILGAGGATRALVHSLSMKNNTVKILNRTIGNAREIAKNTAGPGRVSYGKLTRANLENSVTDTDLVINATPLQTTILASQLRVPLKTFKDSDWVFDLAYDMVPQPMLAKLGQISPLEMLVHQAALSYEIWLKEPAPIGLMRSSLVDYLGQDWK